MVYPIRYLWSIFFEKKLLSAKRNVSFFVFHVWDLTDLLLIIYLFATYDLPICYLWSTYVCLFVIFSFCFGLTQQGRSTSKRKRKRKQGRRRRKGKRKNRESEKREREREIYIYIDREREIERERERAGKKGKGRRMRAKLVFVCFPFFVVSCLSPLLTNLSPEMRSNPRKTSLFYVVFLFLAFLGGFGWCCCAGPTTNKTPTKPPKQKTAKKQKKKTKETNQKKNRKG